MDFLLPLFIVLLGVIAMTIYVLGVALRDSVRRLTAMNERLMVMATFRKDGIEASRALIASSRKPQRNDPGISKSKNQKKKPDEGMVLRMGAL